MSKRLPIGLYFFILTPCLAQPTEVSFVPVRATGTHQVLAPNSIYLPQGGQRIYFEFYVSNWDSNLDGNPKIKIVQVATNVGSYGNPGSPSVLRFPQIPCTSVDDCRAEFDADWPKCGFLFLAPDCMSNDCCQAFFIDRDRTDFLGFQRQHVEGVDTNGSRIGIAMDPGEELQDDGSRKYIGSLVLDVPQDAIGEFTLTFRENETFLHDDGPPGNNQIPIDVLTPAKVFVGVQPATEYRIKPRYFSFVADSLGNSLAYGVRLTSLHHPARPATGSPYQPVDFSGFEGQVRWLGPPTNYPMSEASPQHVFEASRLQCSPHFTTAWSSSPLYVFGAEVIPDSIYEVKAFQPGCTDFDTCGWSIGTFTTGRWADVVPPFEVDQPGSQPDLGDVSGMVDRFKNVPWSASKPQAQLQPSIPDPTRKVNFSDISQAVDAFRGYAYPFQGPTPCP